MVVVSAALQQLRAGRNEVVPQACGEADQPGLRFEIGASEGEPVVLTK